MRESNTQFAATEIAPLLEDAEKDSNFEVLRQILSSEKGREVSYKEAAEIGESLITFYEVLAGVY